MRILSCRTMMPAIGALWPAMACATPDFGPNVTVFSPSTPASQIQTVLGQINAEPQFGTNRHAVLFEPGSYGVGGTVGYYEQIAGLGQSPDDTVIYGGLTAEAPVSSSNGQTTDNATDNFWRSEENFAVAPTTGTTRWAVSQAAPLRRMHIKGGITLAGAYYGWASGGFIADCAIDGSVGNYSQQQYFTRNSSVGGWSNAVWNQVFAGTTGAPAQSFPNPPYTTLATTPVVAEKPYLTDDGSGNDFNVVVPGVKTGSSGTDWTGPAGKVIPISQFLIAQPSTPVSAINAALASGQDLILTPGVYQLSGPIVVNNPDTVILGLGFATLVPQAGTPAISVADVDGVRIAGLIVDAGPQNSPVLLEMGAGSLTPGAHASDPSVLSDVFFRIGGATAGRATTSLQVDSAHVILDDIWAWRADHGQNDSVGWTINTASHGLVVNGDDVTALGLAVEHYQQEQVLWNGNGGETIFYQSEMPYDPPSQSAWMDGSANGYPSYVVSGSVTSHQAYGLGVYSYFDQGVTITADNAITAPQVGGVSMNDMTSVYLNGSGGISNVIDGIGGGVGAPSGTRATVTRRR